MTIIVPNKAAQNVTGWVKFLEIYPTSSWRLEHQPTYRRAAGEQRYQC